MAKWLIKSGYRLFPCFYFIYLFILKIHQTTMQLIIIETEKYIGLSRGANGTEGRALIRGL